MACCPTDRVGAGFWRFISNNRYIFDDEFNGPAGGRPDPAKWSYDIRGGGWGNNELQSYTDSRQNSFLEGEGHLVIRATKTVTRDSQGHPIGIYYNSAKLTTLHHFSQEQGHWEARIQIDQPMFMVLNLTVGGKVGDPSPETPFPIVLLISSSIT